MRNHWFLSAVVLSTLWLHMPSSQASMPVIDIGAITQLITQVRTLEQQLETARSQLTQAERQLDSMTGSRGMESLLAGSQRNYLPTNWAGIQQVAQGVSSGFGALSASIQALISANAILSAQQVQMLTPAQRTQLENVRRSIALGQATAQEALSTASERFSALQQLIEAIASAADQKAVLDLQARIAAEQGMLQNEAIKLDLLERVMRAEDTVRLQVLREQAVSDIGSLRTLVPMGLR